MICVYFLVGVWMNRLYMIMKKSGLVIVFDTPHHTSIKTATNDDFLQF